VPGDDGSHPADLKSDPASERAALEQLIALGYVQRPPDNIEEAVRETQRELDMNRAEALIDGGREADALPILRELCGQWPEEWRFHLRLAMACKTLGRVDELREIVEHLQARRPECEAAREELKTWREEIKRRVERRKADKSHESDETHESHEKAPAPLLTPEEQKTFARAHQFASLNTHGLDFLRAVVALAEKRPTDALELLRAAETGPAFIKRCGSIQPSGPRSGTSLLMQMLAAGGIEPLTDHERTADADNPRGYFELEAVKSLQTDNAILHQATGKAVKVVLPLLPHVPPNLRYHILLIERDLDEIFASQRAMLYRSGQSAHDPATLRPAYERLLRQSRQALAATPIARTLRLRHRWLIEHPAEAARAIASFLGRDLNTSRLAAAIDPALHRQRRTATIEASETPGQ
jgi:tetratricopeptide (TPR) repeat protein